MKLFQQLLVAPAALGLLSPLAANATELNLNRVENYSETSQQEVLSFSDVYPTDWAFQSLKKLAVNHNCNVSIPEETISRYEAAALLNKCLGNIATDLTVEERRLITEFSVELASIKGNSEIAASIGEFEAGAFSSTTTMDGTATFTLGSVTDGGVADDKDALVMQYAYDLALNTSFNGDDLLYVGVETGNAEGPLSNMDSAVAGLSTDESKAYLSVHSMYYVFPVGDVELTVGPLLDQDDVIASTGSVYSNAYRWSSMPLSSDGDVTGPGLAVAYSNDSGFVASASFVGTEGTNSAQNKGLLGDDSADVYTLSAGYSWDSFNTGIVFSSNDEGDAYYGSHETIGVGASWVPEELPFSISATYDQKDPENGNTSSNYFIGVEYTGVGPGTLSAAYSFTDVETTHSAYPSEVEEGMELVYAYPVNDNITISPGVFYASEKTHGKEDDTGFFVETAFSF